MYKLDPIETRFIYTECELKIRFQTGYLSLLPHFLPLWYEYTIFNVFGRRKNKREREKGKGGSMENLNWIQPICLLSVRDRSHVPKINRNVLLERSNPSWRILSSQGHQPSAKVCTTVHGYGNPISDTGQKRLRMSRVAKIYRLIDVPGHAVSPNVTSPPPGTMILDFMRRLTRRENFQPFLSSRFLFSFSSSSSTFHPSEGEEGAAASNRWKIGTGLGALNGYNG